MLRFYPCRGMKGLQLDITTFSHKSNSLVSLSERPPVEAIDLAALLEQQRQHQLAVIADRLAASFDLAAAVRQMVVLSPPPSNTGGESAEAKVSGSAAVGTKTALVDYVRFSVTKPNDAWGGVDGWREWLGGDLDCWREGNGGNFYRESWHLGGWTIYYDGRQEGMGYCVQFSGDGCREFEAHPHFPGWGVWFQRLLGVTGGVPVNFTRLDIALDDRSGELDMSELERCTRAGEYTCRGSAEFDLSPSLKNSQRRGCDRWGMTIYFGRRKSSQLVRFYDKAAEQEQQGVNVEGEWIRCEYECHDERAALVAQTVAAYGLSSVAGLILNYVDFKQPGENKQKCRQETWPWWSAFLDGWEKVRLSTQPKIDSVEKKRAWLEHQISASLATVYQALPSGKRFLADLVQLGGRQMKKKHHDMVKKERSLRAAISATSGPTGF